MVDDDPGPVLAVRAEGRSAGSFFRPEINEAAVAEVVECVRSGWLTTGPRVQRFEREFAEAVGAGHAIAVSSCTAALHLAVESLALSPGQCVLVPTLTFAATAEVVRYTGAHPILVDCDPTTLQMDLSDAARKLDALRNGKLPVPASSVPVGIIPVHVGGAMIDVRAFQSFAEAHGLWMIEDAAHAFPAAVRSDASSPWQRCGERTSKVSCFSFYANKTMTTGEGGMAVTDDSAVADKIRCLSLHGLSNDAWTRYSGGPSWDTESQLPDFKYNMSDIAASLGIHQLADAERMRQRREQIASTYIDAFSADDRFELPATSSDRIDSWHLFAIRLDLDRWSIDRNAVIDILKENGIGCSVHWRPLHLHPYYQQHAYAWRPNQLPVASSTWPRLVSLPIFSAQTDAEVEHVIETVKQVAARYAS